MKQHKNQRSIGKDAGISLVAVVVGLGLAGFVFMIIAKSVDLGIAGGRHSQLREELATIQMTLRTRLDCRRTLNIQSTTTLPATCPTSLVARSKTGATIEIGAWQILPSCTNGELRIGVSRQGLDPLTKKPWANSKIAQDVFDGTSDFCREYLDSTYSTCSGTYDLAFGVGTESRCCRKVQGTKYAPFSNAPHLNSAAAACSAGERIVTGGGGCNLPNLGASDELGFIQSIGMQLDQNRYFVDCHGHNQSGAADAPAYAYAICCPI